MLFYIYLLYICCFSLTKVQCSKRYTILSVLALPTFLCLLSLRSTLRILYIYVVKIYIIRPKPIYKTQTDSQPEGLGVAFFATGPGVVVSVFPRSQASPDNLHMRMPAKLQRQTLAWSEWSEFSPQVHVTHSTVLIGSKTATRVSMHLPL